MKRTALILSVTVMAVMASRSLAFAQAPAVGSPDSPDQTIVEGEGVKIGEGTVMHPVAGAEVGVTSNVFYTDVNTQAAPFLRALVELNFASLSNQRLESSTVSEEGDSGQQQDVGDLQWRAGVRVIGQEYLSSSDDIGAQHNIAGGLNIHGLVFPKQTWQFQFDDDYIRDTRPTNYESSGNLDRDINNLGLQLRYAPEGRALSGALRYQNLIDVFESSDHAFANRIQHTIGLRGAWQWLPITKLYADVSFGFFEPLGNESRKVASTPLRGLAGIQSALTVDTSINARVGFGKAFYAAGADATQAIFGIQFGWRYSPNGVLSLLYSYDFTDSIQANYFRDHMFQVAENHAFGDKITLSTSLDFRLRNYQSAGIDLGPNYMGPTERNDLLATFAVSPRYYFQDWLAATVDYNLMVDSTDYRYSISGDPNTQGVNPSFVRHQLLAGVRAAW
jgi:hypothetical protein